MLIDEYIEPLLKNSLQRTKITFDSTDEATVNLQIAVSSEVNVCPTVNGHYLEAYTTLQCGMLQFQLSTTSDPTPIYHRKRAIEI